jgi:hypothetical protein
MVSAFDQPVAVLEMRTAIAPLHLTRRAIGHPAGFASQSRRRRKEL